MAPTYTLTADPNRRFVALVQATGPCNPMYHPDTRLELEVALAEQGRQGLVLFDLLLTDGQGKTRYQCLHFDGVELDRQVPSPLVLEQRQRYGRVFARQLAKTKLALDLTALTPAQRFAVQEGIIVEGSA